MHTVGGRPKDTVGGAPIASPAGGLMADGQGQDPHQLNELVGPWVPRHARHPREVQASENDNGMPLSVLNKPYQASTSTSRLEGEETTAGGPGTVIRK